MGKQFKSRRNIVAKILVFGSTVFAIGKLKKFFISDKPNKVRLIGKDGKVVEIDSKHMPKMCAGKVSNKRLFAWLQDKEKGNG